MTTTNSQAATRPAALTVTLLALAMIATPATAAAASNDASLPGAYPEPVVSTVASIIENASENLTGNATTHDQVQTYLEQARQELDDGRVRSALDLYVLAVVEAHTQRVVERLNGTAANPGREIVGQEVDRALAEADRLSTASRALVNGLNVSSLTLEGAETAVWGSVLVARGEYRQNINALLGSKPVYTNGTLDEPALRSKLGTVRAAATYASLGASIAATAPSVDGTEVEDDELRSRLDEVANASLAVNPRSKSKAYLPRGNPSDSPILRAGLTLLAGQEIKTEQLQRSYAVSGQRVDLSEAIPHLLEGDRERLDPWARVGSPLALSAYEGVQAPEGDQALTLQGSGTANVLRSRAFALAVEGAEKKLHPDPSSETKDAPAPGLALVGISLVALAALASVRRSPRDRRRGD